jgi:DNA-binding NarL/FixJ family response regulator
LAPALDAMKTADWISILEASYDLDAPSLDAWLTRLLEPIRLVVRRDAPIGILAASYTPSTLDVVAAAHTASSDVYDWFVKSRAVAPPELLTLLHKTTSALLSTSRELRHKFPVYYDEWVRLSGGKVQDMLSVSGHTGDGQVVTAAAFSPTMLTATALDRRCWPRAAAHIAAGLRLYRCPERTLESRRVEAVLTPDGRMCDGHCVAQSESKRELLRQAVRRIDRARTTAGRTDAGALEAWDGLIAGRWSLVDHFDSDGKRFVLAIKNDPEHPDPRGLSSRERQVAEFLGLGQSTKAIAYGLGISEAAVTTHVTTARQKLGLRSRAELAAFFQPSGVCARLAEAVVGGERFLIGSRPLFDNPAVARLTPSEREVADHLLCGSTNKDIAQRRGTSARTIANQVQAIFRKLQVQSRVELAIQLQRAG